MKTINVEGASKVTIEYPDGSKKVVEDEPLPKGFSGEAAAFVSVYSTVSPWWASSLNSTNNQFETCKQAEWAAKHIKFYYALLRASAQALDEAGQLDWVPDWSDEEKKYYVYFFRGGLRSNWTCYGHNLIPVYPSEKIAQRVIDILEHEGIWPPTQEKECE